MDSFKSLYIGGISVVVAFEHVEMSSELSMFLCVGFRSADALEYEKTGGRRVSVIIRWLVEYGVIEVRYRGGTGSHGDGQSSN